LLILPRASDQNLFSLCEKGTQLLLPTWVKNSTEKLF
jgi:hypothetical protein